MRTLIHIFDRFANTLIGNLKVLVHLLGLCFETLVEGPLVYDVLLELDCFHSSVKIHFLFLLIYIFAVDAAPRRRQWFLNPEPALNQLFIVVVFFDHLLHGHLV